MMNIHMTDKSAIEWTDATWNPSTGCSKISPGCKNCYAETMSKRLMLMGQEKYKNNFEYTEHESSLNLPLTWKKPKRIFVNSMSDMFHVNSNSSFIEKCFKVMLDCPQHTFQILTKRPHLMTDFIKNSNVTMPDNVWLGVSVENKDYKFRIDILKKIPCKVKFVSFEPLIGAVGKVDLTGIDWAIIGGESGFNFRLVKEEWIQELIKQCEEQKVKIFFKQWGGNRPKENGRTINGRTYTEYPDE